MTVMTDLSTLDFKDLGEYFLASWRHLKYVDYKHSMGLVAIAWIDTFDHYEVLGRDRKMIREALEDLGYKIDEEQHNGINFPLRTQTVGYQ